MRREPVLVGIAGDSGAGKSTFVRKLQELLGHERVSVIELDGYHSLNRQERKLVGITPLHHRANNLGLFIEHLYRLRSGERVLRPVYDHETGDFSDPVWVEPRPFILVEGLHPFCFKVAADMYDLKIYYDTHQELKIHWKISRDASVRGYTVEQVVKEIRQRQWDIRNFVEPQLAYADLVICLYPVAANSAFHIGVKVKEPVAHSWFKFLHQKVAAKGLVREWVGGREMQVLSFEEEMPCEVVEEMLRGAGPRAEAVLARAAGGVKVTPYQLMLTLLVLRLEELLAERQEVGRRERYAVG
ncbi:phosphoribulokinase/uridine kinase [Ammonifex degensii KC4]|uniref:Phosphoribulokinase n=1 Tax=Ammonifex degensii (strain DSM 10501 / KC4) TaxID=429009 RepID=C9R9G6_AMMDK|nr:phosphoribulokinase [Ammonifex degensii]ACX52945.1 phosphoribulokinase/uridine kinase [Ammonifex degensii KC4]